MVNLDYLVHPQLPRLFIYSRGVARLGHAHNSQTTWQDLYRMPHPPSGMINGQFKAGR